MWDFLPLSLRKEKEKNPTFYFLKPLKLGWFFAPKFYIFFSSKLFQSLINLLVILLDDILQKVKDAGFNIAKIKEAALTREMAAQFYSDHEGKPFFDELVNYMTE